MYDFGCRIRHENNNNTYYIIYCRQNIKCINFKNKYVVIYVCWLYHHFIEFCCVWFSTSNFDGKAADFGGVWIIATTIFRWHVFLYSRHINNTRYRGALKIRAKINSKVCKEIVQENLTANWNRNRFLHKNISVLIL